MLVTRDTSHLERSPLNDFNLWSMPSMVVTRDTSHLGISPLNLSAPGRGFQPGLNNVLISVTAETSQDPIGPCGPLEQSVGDNFRHALMAAVSSAFDLGASTLGVVHILVIFPDEPENISFLLAVDFCHAPQSVLEK